jgi:quercetin dioxygenase-like cupin family protein
LRLAEFTKEFEEADWCIRGHIGYVLSGEMEIDFHGRIATFRPGDGLFIPAGAEHGHKAKVLTESIMVVLVESF